MRLRLLGLSGVLCAASLAAQPVGSEFRVNTYTTGDQIRPAIASTGGGGFVVVWSGPSATDLFNSDIFGQRFNGTGAKIGTEFRVNTYTTSSQGVPAISSDANGNFVVVWQGAGPGDTYAIFGQRYSSAAAPLGPQFRVTDTYTTGSQLNSSVALDAAGDFVVVWTGPGSADDYGVFGQRFTSSGAPLGGVFLANTYLPNRQALPQVASGAAGDFVVVWESYYQEGNGISIYAQRFASGGSKVATEFRVNTVTTGHHSGPVIAYDATGDFVIAWQGEGLGTYTISFRRYTASGTPLGDESSLPVNPRYNASLASGATGDFVIAFDDLISGDVYAQRYSSAGTALGFPFRVNTDTTSTQNISAIAAAGSTFVVTWESKDQDGNGYGVYAQRYGFPACAHGDADANGSINVADVFYVINALFAGGPPPVCSADVNADEKLDVADVFYLVNFLFAGGPPPQ